MYTQVRAASPTWRGNVASWNRTHSSCSFGLDVWLFVSCRGGRNDHLHGHSLKRWFHTRLLKRKSILYPRFGGVEFIARPVLSPYKTLRVHMRVRGRQASSTGTDGPVPKPHIKPLNLDSLSQLTLPLCMLDLLKANV